MKYMGNERIEKNGAGKAWKSFRRGARSFLRKAERCLSQAVDLIWRAVRSAFVAVRADLARNAEMRRRGRDLRRGKPATLLQAKVANAEAGHHFFDTDVAAHSALRLESRLLEGGYFVVSERDGAFRVLYNRDAAPLSDRRYYTVKRFNYRTAEVEDASQPGEFRSKEDALAAALKLVKEKEIGL